MESKVHYINRRYFDSLEEDPYAIWQYLDCIEKIAYHQFQDMSINMEEVFCDDINICLVESEGTLQLGRNGIKRIEHYFEMNRERDIKRPEEYIKKKIDNGLIVGINTYFYDIPNFTWYHKDGYSGDQHICMVVGYDENGFWLTDVPENMKVEYLKDQHITTILYEDMNKFLTKRCNVLTFEKIATTFPKCEDLDDLINKIIKEYSEPSYSENGRIVWKGREAYERLLYLIKENDPRLLEMGFYQGEFIGFIISGRHDILKRNILKKYSKNSGTEEVVRLLETCQNKWKIFAYKILKEILKRKAYTPIVDDIYNIYESEKILMEYLKSWFNSKQNSF